MIPESITIDGIIIPIHHIKNMVRDYSRFGEYSTTDMDINLDDDMCDQKKELILCHEIIEAVIDIHSLDIDHKSVQTLAAIWYYIIKTKQLEF